MNSSKITYQNWDKKVKYKEKKEEKVEKYKNVIKRLTMNDEEKRLMDISTLTGISNWLAVLPITEFGYLSSNSQI